MSLAHKFNNEDNELSIFYEGKYKMCQEILDNLTE